MGPRPRAKSLLIELEAPPPPPSVPAAGQVGRFSTRGGYARRGAPKDIQHFEPRDCHLGPGDQISPEMADKELMDNWRGRFTTDPRLFKDLPGFQAIPFEKIGLFQDDSELGDHVGG